MQSNVKGRILLMESNEAISLITKEALNSEGYHVDIVHQGIRGIQKTKENYYEVVLISDKISDMTSLEILSKLKENKNYFSAIIVSGVERGKDEIIVRAMQMGKAPHENHHASDCLPPLLRIVRKSIRERKIALERELLTQELKKSNVQLKTREKALKKLTKELEIRIEERTLALKEAQEKLIRTEKLAALGELAGAVAHEIRNPLACLIDALYYIELCKKEKSENKKVGIDQGDDLEDYFNIVKKQAEIISNIIDNMLNFARVKKPIKVATDTRKLIQEVIEKHPPPSNIAIKFNFQKPLPKISADPIQISQVITNIVINAYQAMQNGGEMVLSAEKRRDRLSLSCSDTGCGIKEEDLPSIMNPLYSTKPRGTGLGLPICKQLIEQHGGELTIKSKAKRGSIFSIMLPIKGEN